MADDRETHVDVGAVFEQDFADHGVSVPGLRSSDEVGGARAVVRRPLPRGGWVWSR